jgi:hypothetical protein
MKNNLFLFYLSSIFSTFREVSYPVCLSLPVDINNFPNKICFIFSHQHLSLFIWFPSSLSHKTSAIYISPLEHACYTCHSFILRDLVTLISNSKYKLWSSFAGNFLHLPITSFFLHPNTLNTLFSHMWDMKFKTHTEQVKLILDKPILIFQFLDDTRKQNILP